MVLIVRSLIGIYQIGEMLSNLKRHLYDLEQRIEMLRKIGENEAVAIMEMKWMNGRRFLR